MAQNTLDHVEKMYSSGVKALDDLNLDVREGESMVLVGPSGRGKSTALRSIVVDTSRLHFFKPDTRPSIA